MNRNLGISLQKLVRDDCVRKGDDNVARYIYRGSSLPADNSGSGIA